MIVMNHKIVIKYFKTNIYRKICIFFHFSLFLNPKGCSYEDEFWAPQLPVYNLHVGNVKSKISVINNIYIPNKTQ